ncbi:MAG: trypsin-like serine protease [Deltaproteobacteria bacterium]|nr:trypsin-like serine protease [Deltaproteobacteria bacterium]
MLSVASLLAACGPSLEPAPEAVGNTQQPIVNGTIDTGHPAVGLMVSPSSYCSGTLVGRRTVLTAAHCVNGPAHFDLNGTLHEAATIVTHPQYNSTTFEHDIALLLLKTAPQVVPMRIRTSEVNLGSAMTLVGFGITAENATDGEIKRLATNRVAWRSENFYGYFLSVGSWGNSCSGDSGGPALVPSDKDSGELVFGVTSHVHNCAIDGFSTRVDTHADWIRRNSLGDVFIQHDALPEMPQPEPLPSLPPVLTITKPTPGIVGASEMITAEVLLQGPMVSVKAWLGAEVRTLNLDPGSTTQRKSFRFSPPQPGHHTLYAEAISVDGYRVVDQVALFVEDSAAIVSTDPDPDPDPPMAPADALAPQITILSPLAGQRIGNAFHVVTEVDDDTQVAEVTFWVQGQQVASRTSPPFNVIIDTPVGLTGRVNVEVHARDYAGNEAVETVLLERSAWAPGDAVQAGCSVPAGGSCSGGVMLFVLMGLCFLRRRSTAQGKM